MKDFNKLQETIAKVKNITGKEDTTTETTTIDVIVDGE
jgi:archaellum component FlaG (FlaF/FlaG flagellin family)